MNKRNKLIWNFLSLVGVISLIYMYTNTFIYNSDRKWSIPNTNNTKSQSFGGYQRYTKDAKINAESDNNKSYTDFENIVENLESNFKQRQNKGYIALLDPMDPSIVTGNNTDNSKSGYYCYNEIYDKANDLWEIECSYQDETSYIKIGDKIGNATLVMVENNIAILELNTKEKTKLEFELNDWNN